MDPDSEARVNVAFGRFQVLPHRRELLTDDRPIKLGDRAFDVLMALIEARGAVVSKDALMTRVWPDRVVEENNLQAQIVALRKAFGTERDLIRTISGRGYQFTGEISTAPAGGKGEVNSGVTAAETPPRANLPEPVSELIGRDDELREILKLAAAQRLVTLTGAGGIGKTRLALAAAHQLLPQFVDGAWLAEFSPLAGPGLVAATVAAAVGLELSGEMSTQRVAQAIGDRRMLLVLDTCEHVIAAAAAMAEGVLRAGSGVRIIAASREPLRVEGEWVYQVPPLAVPPENVEDAEHHLQYGAVRLFVERAKATEPHFTPDRRSAMLIAAICRRLDGIPLAIELAASRAAALGIEELASRLDDRFRLLTGGRRTALPRHQTLRATLDWSYELLAEPERIVLRRLAIFAGSFSLRAASAIASSTGLVPLDAIDRLSSLVARSLVSTDADGSVVRYRLLDTTRAYALEKLIESGERELIARRHAEYYRDLFERAETEWEVRDATEWLADYRRRIDNLRAALDWACSPDGDASIGVALTAAAVPLWMHLSLIDECRTRVERALAGYIAERDGLRCEMKLYAALAVTLLHKIGPRPEIIATWTKVLELAESLDDTDYEMRALWGLWVSSINGGEYQAALAFAQRFRSLPFKASDPSELLIGDRLVGNSLYYLGDQTNARRHIEHMLSRYTAPSRRSHVVRFQFDQRMAARAILARILWEQGFPDQAVVVAQRSIEDAQELDHALSLCIALAVGMCPVALAIGDMDQAERSVAMLLDYSTRNALTYWHGWGQAFKGVLLNNRRDSTGLQVLASALGEESPGDSPARHHLAFLGEFAEALGRAGEFAKGFAAIDEAINRCERDEGRWCFPELLRIKGELALREGAPNARKVAEKYFLQSLDWTRRQQTLSWELRAVTGLARLRRDQRRIREAHGLLESVYARFTEGFETADLRTARALLGELA
jgi:predicted ATPase/DNA-binding winged helix-turn-helix (wHTH) protein